MVSNVPAAGFTIPNSFAHAMRWKSRMLLDPNTVAHVSVFTPAKPKGGTLHTLCPAPNWTKIGGERETERIFHRKKIDQEHLLHSRDILILVGRHGF